MDKTSDSDLPEKVSPSNAATPKRATCHETQTCYIWHKPDHMSGTSACSFPTLPLQLGGWHFKAGGDTPEMKRLRRLMQPRVDGSYLVPGEIVDKWLDLHGGGRETVIHMWHSADTDKDRIDFFCFSSDGTQGT